MRLYDSGAKNSTRPFANRLKGCLSRQRRSRAQELGGQVRSREFADLTHQRSIVFWHPHRPGGPSAVLGGEPGRWRLTYAGADAIGLPPVPSQLVAGMCRGGGLPVIGDCGRRGAGAASPGSPGVPDGDTLRAEQAVASWPRDAPTRCPSFVAVC